MSQADHQRLHRLLRDLYLGLPAFYNQIFWQVGSFQSLDLRSYAYVGKDWQDTPEAVSATEVRLWSRPVHKARHNLRVNRVVGEQKCWTEECPLTQQHRFRGQICIDHPSNKSLFRHNRDSEDV